MHHLYVKEKPCDPCREGARVYARQYTLTHPRSGPKAEPTDRLISPGQELRIRELSKNLLGDQDRIDRVVGSPVYTWSGVQASQVIAVLLDLEDTQFIGRTRVGNRVSWLRARLKAAS
jgi:hypothetical protein